MPKTNVVNFDQLKNISHKQRDDSTLHRMKITLPFSLFYKEIHGSQAHNMIVAPGFKHVHIGQNFSMTHQHEHFELLYVLEGSLTHHIENNTFHYKKGDACLLNRNTFHSDYPHEDSRIVFLNFSDDFIIDLLSHDVIQSEDKSSVAASSDVRRFLLSNLHGDDRFKRTYLEFSQTGQMISDEHKQAEELISWLTSELLEQKPGNSYFIKGLISRFISLLESPEHFQMKYVRLDSSNEEFLYARIKNYMKERKGRITRAELAQALNYNAEYLNQITKKYSGQSIIQLGKSYCLDEAKRLLTQTDDSISRIISSLGFVSSSHFYNFFRRETGISPKEYRQKYKLPEEL